MLDHARSLAARVQERNRFPTDSDSEEDNPDDIQDTEAGEWTIAGTDYKAAMKTRVVLNVFFKAIIDQINQAAGWGKEDPEYMTIDRFRMTSHTAETNRKLTAALSHFGMTRDEWKKIQQEQRDLNELAHPRVKSHEMVPTVRGYVGIKRQVGPREQALLKAAQIAEGSENPR
jgi:hypothetical protein